MNRGARPWSTILVGLDGSRGASRALAWAIARARDSGATIVAVHVLTYTAEFTRDMSVETVTTWRRELRAQLDTSWVEPARDAGVAVRTKLVEADTVATGLLAAAEKVRADLIVLGTHSRGGLADRMLRATTYHVTHRARRPVVVVPMADESLPV